MAGKAERKSGTQVPQLTNKIDIKEEEEFIIETNDFFRPDLRQIGNSLFKIRSHYCHGGHVCFLPETATSNFKDIYSDLRFLVENSPLFCEGHYSSDESARGLLYISASLVPIFNICSMTIPDSLQCDVLLLFPHQPVMVLSVLEDDCQSGDVAKYNVSLAREMSVCLAKFMDECVSPLCGILDTAVLKNQKAFEMKIEAFRKCSSLFVTSKSFSMTSAKYHKALIAFWASVAETTSVKDRDDDDKEYLRFLTKDQCIILLENIDEKQVVVECQPRCGGSTLMLEVAKRLSTAGETVMVCDTIAERECPSFRIDSISVKTYADMNEIDEKTIQHVVHENGELPFVPNGRVWRFVKTDPCEIPYKKAGIVEAEYKLTESKLEDLHIEKLSTSTLELLKGYIKTTGRKRILNLLDKLAEHKKEIFHPEKFPFHELEEEVVSMMLQAPTFQSSAKDVYRLQTCPNSALDAFKAKISIGGRDDQNQEMEGGLLFQITELEKRLQDNPDIFHNIRQEIMAAKKTISYLEGKVAYLNKVKQSNRDSQQDKSGRLDVQKPVAGFLSSKDEVTRSKDMHYVHQLRQFEHGKLKHGDLLDVLKKVIREAKKMMSLLHTESKSLEEAFGCPLYIVGEAESRKSESTPLSCPLLTFDKDRVNTDVTHISEDDELINLPTKSSNQGSSKFHRYRGTCTVTSIPFYLSDTEFPPCPQYWETRVRGLVKRDVPVWRILFETGVSEKSQMDTKYMESAQLRSWCFVLADCGMHEGICTKIWGEGKLIKCIRNTMTNSPNSYNVHNYGTVLDVWRGKLAFLDLNSQTVLHKFNIDFKEDLYPMCGEWLYPDDYLVGMKLVSGAEIVMTAEKLSLIHQALYTHDEDPQIV